MDNKGKQERRPPFLLCETAISGDTQRLHSAANTGHFVISTQNEIKQQDGSVQQFNHTERQKDSWLWTHYVMLETTAWHFYVHLFFSLPSLLNYCFSELVKKSCRFFSVFLTWCALPRKRKTKTKNFDVFVMCFYLLLSTYT